MKADRKWVVENIGDRNTTLEDRLAHFYIVCELIWAFVNGVLSLVIGMPAVTTVMYWALFFGVALYFIIGQITNKSRVFLQVYFILVLFSIPVMWYFAGGSKSSASILFVCQVVLFVMCFKGNKQKIYMVIALISSGLVQGVTRRFENPVYPMTPEQYAKGGAVLGLTTCLLISSVLIRQKKEYESELQKTIESEKELERSNSLQKNFLANMSHEIRSPLGIVMGFNNLIAECEDIEQIHEYAKDIKQAGATLLTVINDILDYSKIESGKLTIIEEDYLIRELLFDIDREIELKCTEKGLRYIAEIDEKLPACLHGDSIRIKQCLLNILSNAVKYTDNGEVVLSVQYKGEDDNHKAIIEFVVKDTGKGIRDEAMPNLFSSFQRLDEGMNRGIEGTGLGLAITKNLMDEMEGEIEVKSSLGVGTTFVLRLSQIVCNTQKEEIRVGDDTDLADISVLVVDDTALNLTLVRKLLEKQNAIVTTIDNGKDCLKDVETNKYDIILLDHMMPEINGVEVFLKMKEQKGINDKTPIVMLTANAMVGAMQEYIEMGFDGYLSKPIAPDKLKEMVIRLVKGNK